MIAMKVSNISVQIPVELDAWLEAEATREFCSKSAIARKILARHISKEKHGNTQTRQRKLQSGS